MGRGENSGVLKSPHIHPGIRESRPAHADPAPCDTPGMLKGFSSSSSSSSLIWVITAAVTVLGTDPDPGRCTVTASAAQAALGFVSLKANQPTYSSLTPALRPTVAGPRPPHPPPVDRVTSGIPNVPKDLIGMYRNDGSICWHVQGFYFDAIVQAPHPHPPELRRPQIGAS